MPDQRYSRREAIAVGVATAIAVTQAGAALAAASAGEAADSAAGKNAGAADKAVGINTRAIPSTGERLPVVGLGTNNYSPATPEERAARLAVVEQLPQLGGAVIDTAPAYRQSETVLGELMAEIGNRERIFLASKVTAADGDRAKGVAMLEESFRRLRTGRIDLMQVHNLMGVDVMLPVLAQWKQAGRIRYVGITTSNASQYPEMLAAMRKHTLDFIQVDYSIANRGAAEAILPLAKERGQAVLINMPFGGRRDGNVFRHVAGKALPDWAQEIEAASWGQFLLKYVVSHPAVTCAIPGMTRTSHLEDNLGALRGPLPDAAFRRRMEALWDDGIMAGDAE
jgi:aryl-alcohol dehydrogenase-like predicted oxidoreductase